LYRKGVGCRFGKRYFETHLPEKPLKTLQNYPA
jgi:hypothetical protein